jgi:S1-C subfamily serine protease
MTDDLNPAVPPVQPPTTAPVEADVPPVPDALISHADAPAAPPIANMPVVPPAVPPVVTEAPLPVPASATSRPRHGGVIAVAVILSFIVASFSGLAAGFLGARLGSGGSLGTGTPTARVEIIEPKTTEPIVAAAAAGLPSVVNIDVRGGTARGSSSLPSDHPGVPTAGTGSGVAYKSAEDGGTYIITNNHVVEDASTLTVRDSTGDSMKATLVGLDPESDIAVIKVDRAIPLIKISDSSKLRVGQSVVAIGSPFGLEHSVTSGVVSALGRSLPQFESSGSGAYPLVDVIQTDAAINPGNSGGALVDRTGKLVGINTAIYSDSGASGGIGFAVPSNSATRIADQLIEGGGVTHPFLGVVGQTITPDLASAEKLAATEGTLVRELTKGSGAEKADVRVGDVITAANGTTIRSIDDLILNVRRLQIGDTVTLTVLRDGKKLTIEVVVGDKPADLTAPSAPTTSVPGTATPKP